MTQEELLDIVHLAELKQGEIWSDAHQQANAFPDSKDAQVKENLAWAKLCKLHTTMLNLVDEINGYHHLERGELR